MIAGVTRRDGCDGHTQACADHFGNIANTNAFFGYGVIARLVRIFSIASRHKPIHLWRAIAINGLMMSAAQLLLLTSVT